MKQLYALARFTVNEHISSKIFNGFIFFGIVIMFFTAALKELALYEGDAVVRNIGLLVIEVFVLLIAVFISSTQFLKDKKEKSIYLVLTKPVSKSMYIIGRFLGMIFTLLFNVILMGVALLIVLKWQKADIGIDYYLSLLFIFYKIGIITAIGIMFSVMSDSAVTSNIFTISAYVVGMLSNQFKELSMELQGVLLKGFLKFGYYVFPNFGALNYRDFIGGQMIDVKMVSLYVIGYVLIVVGIANLIFKMRKL